ncbi:MAG TPA: hypothetical protein VMU48_05460 [Terracidiphilus sp.]|nr:hypothetical protein [Terracidiphilus sp.]
MSAEPISLRIDEEPKESKAFQVLGWFSAGIAVAALGIYLGNEFRLRYRFNHRTPYDFYSKAAEQQASEFGVGI